jgi:hypothetical protein
MPSTAPDVSSTGPPASLSPVLRSSRCIQVSPSTPSSAEMLPKVVEA